VKTRCDEVMAVFTDQNAEKNTVKTFKQSVFGEQTGNHQAREQVSLIKLVKGYNPCTRNELASYSIPITKIGY
jgi:hypothetical protein